MISSSHVSISHKLNCYNTLIGYTFVCEMNTGNIICEQEDLNRLWCISVCVLMGAWHSHHATLTWFCINWTHFNAQISGDMATEHINGNSTDEPVESSPAPAHSEHFQLLLDAGLPRKVAVKLDEIYLAGKNFSLRCCGTSAWHLCFVRKCLLVVFFFH